MRKNRKKRRNEHEEAKGGCQTHTCSAELGSVAESICHFSTLCDYQCWAVAMHAGVPDLQPACKYAVYRAFWGETGAIGASAGSRRVAEIELARRSASLREPLVPRAG